MEALKAQQREEKRIWHLDRLLLMEPAVAPRFEMNMNTNYDGERSGRPRRFGAPFWRRRRLVIFVWIV